MDDPAQIDLALNTDFDPSLFDGWDETATKPENDNQIDGDDDDDDDDEEDDDDCSDVDDDKMMNSARNTPAMSAIGDDGNAPTTDWEVENDFRRKRNRNVQIAPLPSFMVDTGEDKEGSLSNLKQIRASSSLPGLQSTDGSSYAHTSSSVSTSGMKHNDGTTGNPSGAAGSHSLPGMQNSAPQLPMSVNTTTSRTQQQLHPLAIPSSANCPPHLQQQEKQQQQLQQNFFQQMSQQHDLQQHGHHHNVLVYGQQHPQQQQSQSPPQSHPTPQFMQQMDPSLLPLAFNATLAAGALAPGNTNIQSPVTYFLVPQQQQITAASTNPCQIQQSSTPMPQQPQSHHNNTSQPKAQHQPLFDNQTLNSSRSSGAHHPHQQQHSTAPQHSSQSHTHQRHRGHVHQHQHHVADTPAAQNPSDLPPFLLFDAPIELRANYIQSQKQHGIPTMQDNNSIHYGMIVNGFHPQQGQAQPSMDTANVLSRGSVNAMNSVSTGQVKLIDGRHGNVGNKRVKNAREQKRTQKITDLIDELRVKMERGGWKVGLKSKFHTLSSCAEYVKHLVEVNVEKEEALKKARADLEAKNRKLEEDDKAQQDPSDPESTTSSLTVSTSSAAQRPEGNEKVNSGDAANTTTNNINAKKKEKAASKAACAGHDTKKDHGIARNRHSKDSDRNDNEDPHKKPRLSTHESSLSSATSSAAENSGKQDRAQGVSVVDAMVSSVSDLTDSNKGGSSEGNCSSSSQRSASRDTSDEKDTGETGSAGGTGSVSSDAAVARGHDNHGHDTSHADVVIMKTRKRKAPPSDTEPDSKLQKDEPTSLEKSFQLDYEEVFLKSNVPQILATTSGRIVAWNDFFLKITGLKADEVERLTFFSLVQSNRLSTLFEIVAAALRSGTMQTPNESSGVPSRASSASSTSSDAEETKKAANTDNLGTESDIDQDTVNRKIWNYSAITLPCVSFHPSGARLLTKQEHREPRTDIDQQNQQPKKHAEPRPVYITVTLMTDEDPRKRCFHCVFTDCPGTNGALGSITPELLSQLFTKQNMSPTSQECAHNKRKRQQCYSE